MQSIQLEGAFGVDNLHLTAAEPPGPGPGEVQLRMHAASLNYRDLLMVRGHYNPRQPLPLVPCSDGVGEVVEVGPAVTRVVAGDRVNPIFAQAWLSGPPRREHLASTLGGPLDGTLREFMVVPQEAVVRVAEHLTNEEAACLPCAGVTAWRALTAGQAVQPGDTVLVQGTGGVSLFALQFSLLSGARVIVTSSSQEKLERALELGAWRGINYLEDPAWGQTARGLTSGRGVDHVVEVGGAGTLQQSLQAVRPGGQISVIGVLSGTRSELDVTPILMQGIRLQGVLVGHRRAHEEMMRAIAAHELRPIVDRVFELGETQAAFEHMAAGAHFGKIAIRVDTSGD